MTSLAEVIRSVHVGDRFTMVAYEQPAVDVEVSQVDKGGIWLRPVDGRDPSTLHLYGGWRPRYGDTKVYWPLAGSCVILSVDEFDLAGVRMWRRMVTP